MDPDRMRTKQEKKVIGWREWVHLPQLGIKNVKAKIDTGARTSSLHAFDIVTFKRRGIEYVKFKVHPNQRDSRFTVSTEARIHEYRSVKSSTGHASMRPVIVTQMQLLDEVWDIELTLANRDEMGFRMLLGREGFRGKMLVDASKSYYSEVPKRRRTAKKKAKIKKRKSS